MQYSYNLTLSDGEIGLLKNLLSDYINNLKYQNIPIGLFAKNIDEKINYNINQLIHKD
jgi:hypothetical protein